MVGRIRSSEDEVREKSMGHMKSEEEILIITDFWDETQSWN